MNTKAANRYFPDNGTMIPRFRHAGEVTLDLFHRDGRVDDRWLAFHPREFEVLWRLAEEAGQRVTKRQLLFDVWRIDYEPETNSVAVHIARIRNKLEPLGLAGIVATHPDGGDYVSVMPRDIEISAGGGSRT